LHANCILKNTSKYQAVLQIPFSFSFKKFRAINVLCGFAAYYAIFLSQKYCLYKVVIVVAMQSPGARRMPVQEPMLRK
jgi:hypothetical protein